MAKPAEPTPWLRRIFGLQIVSLALLCFLAWQVHGVKVAVEQQDKEMPSVIVTVKATRSSNGEVVEIPITTTQGEMAGNEDETEAEWITRTWQTKEAWKTAIENS